MSFSVEVAGAGLIVRVSPVSGYSYYQIYWRKSTESTAETSGWLSSAPPYYPITGLDPGTEYVINVGYNTTGAGGADGFMGAVAKTTGYSRPQNWYWAATVTQGGPVTTVEDGSGGYLAKFVTAARWNAFCDRVADFEVYVKHAAAGDYANCKVTAGDAMLASTAAAIRTKISALSPPTPPPGAPQAGQVITAEFFLALAASLNSIV